MGVTFVAVAAEHPLALRLAKDNPTVDAFVKECQKVLFQEADIATMERKAFRPASMLNILLPVKMLKCGWATMCLCLTVKALSWAYRLTMKRDFAFALKYGLPIEQVIGKEGHEFDKTQWHDWYADKENIFCVNSGKI